MNPMNTSTASGSVQGNRMSGKFNDQIPKGYKMGQIQQFTPQQMNLMNQNMGMVGPDSYLSRLAGGDQSAYGEMEAPAMRQFQELQGQNASRFSGMGMGARRGSGFQNAMNQSTSDFAQDLAAKRMDYRRQAIQDLMGFSSNLLGQRPYERNLIKKAPKEPKWWERALPLISPAGADAMQGGTENSQNFAKMMMMG